MKRNEYGSFKKEPWRTFEHKAPEHHKRREGDMVFITNFPICERKIYEEAIAISNDATLSIREMAYDICGHVVGDCSALWSKGEPEHQHEEFWKALKMLREKQNT